MNKNKIRIWYLLLRTRNARGNLGEKMARSGNIDAGGTEVEVEVQMIDEGGTDQEIERSDAHEMDMRDGIQGADMVLTRDTAQGQEMEKIKTKDDDQESAMFEDGTQMMELGQKTAQGAVLETADDQDLEKEQKESRNSKESQGHALATGPGMMN
jgi:hypothetical protein